jgi:archaemetzincin
MIQPVNMTLPIRLLPLVPVAEEIVHALVTPLSQVFRASVTVARPLRGITDTAYDDSRAQYNSTQLIHEMLLRESNPSGKILGITSVDLFVPILTYVFGEAQLGGTASVMSIFRLDDTIYGLPPDSVKLFERALKEAVHELGHTLGLLHCGDFACAMHASTTVDDVDVKGATLCDVCLKQIGDQQREITKS